MYIKSVNKIKFLNKFFTYVHLNYKYLQKFLIINDKTWGIFCKKISE